MMPSRRALPGIAAAASLLLQACGIHQATLINNVTDPGDVDLRRNGVLAFELAEPRIAKVRCWAQHAESGDLYQLDQDIGIRKPLRDGIGPLHYSITPTVVQDTRTVHLYELPPGAYVLKHFRIEGTEIKDTRAVTPDLVTAEFRIAPGQVTYTGTHLLSGEWALLKPTFRFRTVDRFARVDSTLGQERGFGLKELPRTKHLSPWDWKPD